MIFINYLMKKIMFKTIIKDRIIPNYNKFKIWPGTIYIKDENRNQFIDIL